MLPFHTSSASFPRSLPGTVEPAAAPELLRPLPEKPRHGWRWFLTALALAAIAGAAWLNRHQMGAAKPAMAELRAVTIAAGDLDRTIRVSGLVTAEKFGALMAPRLRGSRNASGGFGAGGTKSVGTGAPSASSSSATASATSTSSSSTSSAGAAAAGFGQNSAAGSTNSALNAQSANSGAPGAPASSLGAIRGTTNRFTDRQTSQTSANKFTTSGSGQSTSSTLGANGLGSTSAGL